MRNLFWIGLFTALTLLGCSDQDAIAVAPRTHVARTGGSAVALSADERVAVVTNRSAGIVSIFGLAPENAPAESIVTHTDEIDMGADSEPWAAVIGLDDDTAYVVFRRSQTVEKITALRSGNPVRGPRVHVGSEPSAIAISPSGQKLFVANWGEGTVSVISTQEFVEQVKIDLNQSLVDTGALGTVLSRQALAHPRALALTDNGDGRDEDETLYVTEFFSQPIPGLEATGELYDVDRNRQAFVYPISLKNGQAGTAISIAPVQETGFEDATGKMTGCFPNQLYAAAVDRGRLYVTSVCTSPRGPLGAVYKGEPTDKNFKTLMHSAVFVVDTSTNRELPAQGRLLTRVLDGYYQDGEDTTGERMPLIPNDIAFTDADSEGSHAYVSALGSDAIYRIDYDAFGTLQSIGSADHRYIDAQATRGLPTGVAVSKVASRAFALVPTDTTQRLSIVDLATETVASVDVDNVRAREFKASDENKGHGFFGTGREVWSYKGQAWSSCEGCHPGGGSDGVIWFFARGPRRTISTASTYDKNSDLDARTRRMMLWGANIDEVHDIEAITRGVSGGVGAILWGYDAATADTQCRLLYDGSAATASGMGPCQAAKSTTLLQNGLNGALLDLERDAPVCSSTSATCDRNGLPDWSQIERYVRAERPPLAPTGLDAGDIAAGLALFREGRCAGCHGGSGWTVSKLFYKPGAEENGALPYGKPTLLPNRPPTLNLGALRSLRYSVAPELLSLNPAALAQGGSAFYRVTGPAGISDSDLIEFYYGSKYLVDGLENTTAPGDDQILCALRDVGTFPPQSADPKDGFNATGITPAGTPTVLEYRQDMMSPAQGQRGFNVPSLFGLSVGAPYFHAGNARTLEEVFDSATFARHHQALAAGFLANPAQRDAQIAQLVTFLLAIDQSTPIEVDQSPFPERDDFCTWSVR